MWKRSSLRNFGVIPRVAQSSQIIYLRKTWTDPVQNCTAHPLHNVRLSGVYKHVKPLWSCPALQSLWEEIFRSSAKVTGKSIEPNAMIALFSVIPATVPVPVHHSTTLLPRGSLYSLGHPSSHKLYIAQVATSDVSFAYTL